MILKTISHCFWLAVGPVCMMEHTELVTFNCSVFKFRTSCTAMCETTERPAWFGSPHDAEEIETWP
jgi:hypothetical protein